MLIHMISTIASAQRYPFRTYNVAEGISQSQINDIIQDYDGYLWFASAEGLTRFNGHEFKTFGKSDGLAGSLINKILLDSEGNMWLGYRDKGVSKYLVKEKIYIPVFLPAGLETADIVDIIETVDGSLLFATDDDGVLIYHEGIWKLIDDDEGLPSNKVFSLCSVNDKIWIGTARGLCILSGDQFEVDTTSYKSNFTRFADEEISALMCDHEENIWISTAGSGIFRFIPNSETNGEDTLLNVSELLNLPQIFPQCIIEDQEQNIWVGTKEKGVIRFGSDIFGKDSVFVIINKQNGLDRVDISTIFQDSEGSFWFGSNGGGVYQYRGNCFEKYGEMEGLLDDVIWAIFEDQQGGFWFGSENGLTHVKNGEDWQDFYYFSSDQWQGSRSILDIDADLNGNLWLVVHNSGIRVLNSRTKLFSKVPELEDKKVICIERGNANDFWFGTFDNGTFYMDLDSGIVINYKADDGLASNTVYDIIKSSKGDIWFATNNAGITKYDGSKFINYGRSSTFENSSVLTLAENSKGDIWIGTEGEGLFRFDGQKFESYSQKYGLWKDDIYSVVCDDQDNVFIGTRRGIEKFSPSDSLTKKFGKVEGFSAVETNQNSVYKDAAGRLWFGTIQGAIRYNPASERRNNVPPKTYIDNVRVFLQDQPLPVDSSYVHTDNHLTFNYTGLSFVAPEDIKYSYLLEGLDRDWSPLSSERYATYANLSPGEYTFKVKSINSESIWSKEPASYKFSIRTPFWQKSWFYVLLVFSIGAIIYGSHRYHVRKIYKNNLLLEKMVHSRTSDLVTEKEKAQEAFNALRESEQKLKQVTESINAYLWSLNIDDSGNLENTFITDTFFKIVGYDRHEFPQAKNKMERFLKIVHEDDRQYIRESFIRAKKGETINLNYRIVSKEQEYHWHYIHAFPIEDVQGKVNLIHGVGFDITNRKLAEEALRKSEEKYATFLRYSTEAIWCVDLKEPIPVTLPVEDQIERILHDAYLSDCNDAMANLYGYNLAIEIIGLPLSAGLLRDVPENRQYLHQFIESGYRLRNAEFKELDNSGNVKIMLVGFVGILEKGHLVRAWGMQRDITEQRRAEEALRESEEMYRRLIERSPDTIIVHSEGKIDYINSAGVKLYGGKHVSDFLGHKLKEFSHSDFWELGQMRIQQIYQEKREVSLMEQKMVRLDGTEFDVEVMGAPIIYNGRASGQSIVRDITERKKMEAEIQKGQKLDSVGILAGGIAHDFNNILTAILGNISLGKMYTESHGEANAVLSEAERATLRAKDLTQQLLTFSKGGAPVKETTSIYEIIKDSTNFVLRGSNIDADYECPSNLWSVDVDAAQISQVIQNLIINAEQAMPDGKRILIRLENKELKKPIFPNMQPGKFVEVRIIDKGIGISDEHLSKIFDPYFTTKQKGSGLGLATSYSIIIRHGGHINITSQMGKGTEVLIYIPASDKQVPEKKIDEDKILSGNGRILVMDDERLLLQLSEQFLSHLGYQVTTVTDGENAIKEYRRASQEGSPFSLVIMDLTIPGGMGGKETIKELRKIDPNVRAVVSSGYSNDPVMANYMEFGFQAVLTKPYKIETMSSVIAEVVNEHSA